MKKLLILIMTIALMCTMMPATAFAADDTTGPKLMSTSIYDRDGNVYEDVPRYDGQYWPDMSMWSLHDEKAIYIQTTTADGLVSREIVTDIDKLKVVDKNGKKAGTLTRHEKNEKFFVITLSKFQNCYLQYDDGTQTLQMPIITYLPAVSFAKKYKSPKSTFIETLNVSASKTNSFYVIAPKNTAKQLKAYYSVNGKEKNISITKKNTCFTAKRISYKAKTVYKITLKRPFVTDAIWFSVNVSSNIIKLNLDLSVKLKVTGQGKVFDETDVYADDLDTSSTKARSILDYERSDMERGVRYFVYVEPAEGYKFAGFYYGKKKLSVDGPYADRYYKIVDSTGKMVNQDGEEKTTLAWNNDGVWGIDLEQETCEKNNWNTSGITFTNGYAWVSLEQYLAATGYTNAGLIVDGGQYVIFNAKSINWYGGKAGNGVTKLAGKTITAKFVKI